MCKAFVLIIFCLVVLSACANTRSKLTETKCGINHHFTQEGVPSEEEKKIGLLALRKWKSYQSERSRLADELILGNTLKGLSTEDVVASLGSLEANYENGEFEAGKSKTIVYGLPLGNWSQNDLVIELSEDGKVDKTYIDVNY